MSLTVVPIGFDEACEFIRRYHRHHKPPHIVCGACLAVIARDRRALLENERLCREAAAMEREERERMKAIAWDSPGGHVRRVHLKADGIFSKSGVALGINSFGTLSITAPDADLTPAQAIDLGQTLIEWGKTGKLEASE